MVNWTEGTCNATGLDVHYIRTGGDKPAVVLLHGLMLNGACWIDLARSLEDAYDVIIPDARGHGLTSVPSDGYCYETLAADVVNFIDTLELKAPVLLGHSMGGMTAAVVANHYPSRLGGLILADPTFLTLERQREVYASDVATQHNQILNGSRDRYLAAVQARHRNRSQELNERFVQARFQTSLSAFEILKPPNPDYEQLMHRLCVPCLMIIGDVGAVVSLEVATELAKHNQHIDIMQIANAGHAVPYDQPERFAAVVKDFLYALHS